MKAKPQDQKKKDAKKKGGSANSPEAVSTPQHFQRLMGFSLQHVRVTIVKVLFVSINGVVTACTCIRMRVVFEF